MSIAEDVYGKDSEEWKRANKAVETAYGDLEKRKKSKEQKFGKERR